MLANWLIKMSNPPKSGERERERGREKEKKREREEERKRVRPMKSTQRKRGFLPSKMF